MKSLLKAVLATAVLCTVSASFAAPTMTFVKSIDVGTILTAPSGIAADASGNLYIVGFTNNALCKVTTPLGTPGASTLVATLPGTYPALRGPQGIAAISGNLFIVGDDGTNGVMSVYSTAGTLVNTFSTVGTDGTQGRICAIGPELWGGKVLLGRSASSPVLCADPFNTGSALTGNSTAPTGSTSAIRGAVPVGNDVYAYSSPATNNTISKITGGTAGSWTSYATTATWNTLNGANGSGAFVGLGKYVSGSATYVVALNVGNGAVTFYNAATSVADLTFTDSVELPTGSLRGMAFATIGGADYIFITRNSGTPANAVAVYRLNGFAEVQDWTSY